VAPGRQADHRAEISLDWLIRLRWGALAGLLAAIAVARQALDAPLPLPRLAGLASVLLVSNALLAIVRRRVAYPRALCGGALALDTLALTGLLRATGGAANPFSVLYLVYITLSAVVLGARWTWFLAALSVACYGLHYLTKPADVDEILAAFARTAPAVRTAPARAPSLARVEWEHINRVLNDCGGNVSEAARALGIHRRSLQRKLAKFPSRR